MPARATLAERRKIGAYYTPQTVTDALAEWAIRNAHDTVLEPGFGGCGFLESCANRLSRLGANNASSQLYGCDIDPHAFRILYSRLGLAQVKGHFVLSDFLALDVSHFKQGRFDVVIGNPPYIRHHHIEGQQALRARAIRDRVLPSLNRQASLWAYFVIHACEFLKVGARVAWILPSSFLHAYYAKELSAYLHENFARVRVVRLDERIFEGEGADEGSVVVVAEGWGSGKSKSLAFGQVERVRSVADLKALLAEASPKSASRGADLFEELAARADRLGDYCKLSIGIVTGDADFFLFNREKAETHGIRAKHLAPIVSRAKLASGLSVSTRDLRRAFERGAPSMILDTRGHQSATLKQYLESMSKRDIEANLTFGKRPVWHRPLDGIKADVFFTCMSHFGPRLVLNGTRNATCTNTLYRGSFHENVTRSMRRALAIGLQSSFGQLSAERHGRAFGAGMLKHEPSEAEAIRLLVSVATEKRAMRAFAQIDARLKAGDEDAAREAADEHLIATGTMSARDCRKIQRALREARALRWGDSFS